MDLSQAAAGSKNGSEILCIQLMGAKKGQKTLEPVEDQPDECQDGGRGIVVQSWRKRVLQERQSILCTNLTCKLACEKIYKGTLENGECISYEILSKVCVTIDLEESSPNSTIVFTGGCFGDENSPTLYTRANSSETYNLTDIFSLELRYAYDPYTSVAGEDQDLGRDLEYVALLSYIFLGIAVTLFLIVLFLRCWLS